VFNLLCPLSFCANPSCKTKSLKFKSKPTKLKKHPPFFANPPPKPLTRTGTLVS